MNLGLKAKLTSGFLLMGILPALLGAVIAAWYGSNILHSEAEIKLVTMRDMKAQEMKEMFRIIRGQARTLASSLDTRSALLGFAGAYQSVASEITEKGLGQQKIDDSLAKYYTNEFGKQWEAKNQVKTGNAQTAIKSLPPETRYLQYVYISENPSPLGEKNNLTFPNDNSRYSNAHNQFHHIFNDFLKEFGYYDIFLIDAESGTIVYSVFKEIDFATSLIDGPFAKTKLGEAYQQGLRLSPGEVHFTDLDRYFPSYDAPAGFVSTPIVHGNSVIGVLAMQIPIERIEAIMTNNYKWREAGFGESGEAYLIGQDHLMRSVSRSLIEQKAWYLETAKERGIKEENLRYMAGQNTSVMVQKIETEAAIEVTQGRTGYKLIKDYRGVPVLSAYEPLDIPGMRWSIITEFDEYEALAGVRNLNIALGTLIAITAIIIFFISWNIGTRLANAITAIAKKLANGSHEVAEASQSIAAGATELSEATTEQAASLQETSSAVDEISAMVNKSAENALHSQNRAKESQQRIREGKKAIEDMLGAMDDIRTANQHIMDQVTVNNREFEEVVKVITEIGSKTKVINDIVFQTKLLSFNASVEAARAGEHGKGFAVVAEEVGNLAQMSGNASKEISDMLDESIKKVNTIATTSKSSIENLINRGKNSLEGGNKKAIHTDRVFDEIMHDSDAVTSIVEEIASSSKEQAIGIQEVTRAMGQLDQATQQNSTVAQQSAAASDALSRQSLMLRSIVGELEAIVHGEAKDSHLTEVSTRREPEATKTKIIKMPTRAKKAAMEPPRSEFKKAVGSAKVPAHTGGSKMPAPDDPRFEDL